MRSSVSTWNVEYAAGADRNARRCQLLQAAAADVVVLTETHNELKLLGYTANTTLQREGARPGARWTTISTRRGVRRRIETADPTRTVAVELEDDVIVYGTVLPWHTDTGPSGRKQVIWAEFRRVLPVHGAEWRALRQQHPWRTLVVAGDFPQSLSDRQYYGSRELRRLLERECAEADLVVHTASAHEQIPLLHPAIDHIAVAPPLGWTANVDRVFGWAGTREGRGRLSDHSAVGVVLHVEPQMPQKVVPAP